MTESDYLHLQGSETTGEPGENILPGGCESELDLPDLPPTIPVEKTREDAIIPERQNPGDSGFDLALPMDINDMTLEPGRQELVMLGFRITIPQGYEGQIRPRSSLTLDHKITVPNTPGTVDSEYREEMGVILYNYDESPWKITPGTRVAQLVIAPVSHDAVLQEGEVPEEGRGGGFGSTGT